MEEVHRSVKVPSTQWWRRMFAFAGPAYMVSVGYMDPGNWATDIAGGSTFGYTLLWVLLVSNGMAVLLQTLSARLGLVTGRDLAQACHDDYPPAVRYILFVLCEIAIAACDLAEVLGSAVGLNLLTGIPLMYGVLITGADVLILLVIQRAGIRKMEAFIILLIAAIGLCFISEIFLCKPSLSGIASGLLPRPLSGEALYLSIGIIGATVMPHNLYLHSSLVQSRDVTRSVLSVVQACKYNFIDSLVAMNCAFLVNGAILIVAAASFTSAVTELQDAHQLLGHVLGPVAPVAFALALLCAGQSSTVTGTLAGQITMEGFLHFQMRAWVRRLLTRSLAIIPAVAVIAMMGDRGVYKLLVFSQVILSLQLPFAVVPLIKFTSSRMKMGPFASRLWVKVLAWAAAALIIGLNADLVYEAIVDWSGTGLAGKIGAFASAPVAAGLLALLVWMIARRERAGAAVQRVTAQEVADAAAALRKTFHRIGVALEAGKGDAPMLAEAIALARVHRADLVLIHVVEGVGGQWYGPQTGDMESRHDEEYLDTLARRLRQDLAGGGLGEIIPVLGYGDVSHQISRLVRDHKVDLLVVGGHGHRGLGDVVHGQTISTVRHNLNIPIFAVRR